MGPWARPGALSWQRGPGLGPSAGGAGPGPAWGPQSIRRNPHQKITFLEFCGKQIAKNKLFGDLGVNICDVLRKSELSATHHILATHHTRAILNSGSVAVHIYLSVYSCACVSQSLSRTRCGGYIH